MMQIVETKHIEIRIDEMQDGQIAVITNWGTDSRYVGHIVQRYGNNLVTLAADSGHGWSNFFIGSRTADYLVKILHQGTTIRITSYDKSPEE